jgi:hypothetical protein
MASLIKVIDETVAPTETIKLFHVRTVAETVAATEAIVTHRHLVRLISESIGPTENINLKWVRMINENIGPTEFTTDALDYVPLDKSEIEYSSSTYAGAEHWTDEREWVGYVIEDSITGKYRVLGVTVANPRNEAEDRYFSFQRLRCKERLTKEINFVGRIELIDPDFRTGPGHLLKLQARDYSQELASRIVDFDYSDQSLKISELLTLLIARYSYDSMATDIEESGSTGTVSPRFDGRDRCLDIIEDFAKCDFWSDETFDSVLLWDNSATEWTNLGTSGAGDWMGQSSDYVYFGLNNPCCGMDIDITTAGSYGTLTWQYWNGAWTALTLEEETDFTEDSRVRFIPPGDWVARVISNSSPHPQVMVDSCDSAWTASANVTASADATDEQEGTACCKLVVADAFTTGTLAYHDISETDLTDCDTITLWVKTDQGLDAGDLQLVLISLNAALIKVIDEDVEVTETSKTFQSKTIGETVAATEVIIRHQEQAMNFPAIADTLADTWTQVTISLADVDSLDAVDRVAIKTTKDLGADATLKFDAIAAGNVPDTTSRYWFRVFTNAVTTTVDIEDIEVLRGIGYDFRVTDEPEFQYFRRGSKPTGGAESNGLTIALEAAEGDQTIRMMPDYTFVQAPKEVVTRVTANGKDITGETLEVTVTNSELEDELQVIREKVITVKHEITSSELTDIANAYLRQGEVTPYRGKVKIAKYPQFTVGATTTMVRAGDLVHIECEPKSLSMDMCVLNITYVEPDGVAELELISIDGGRGIDPLNVTDLLKDLSRDADYGLIGGVGAAKIVVGYYVGDGTTTGRHIETGFRCKFVIIQGDSASGAERVTIVPSGEWE